MRKIASSIIVTSLFLSLLILAFNIKPVKADEPIIYIHGDGSVDGTAMIQRDENDENLYNFLGDITGIHSLVVEKSDIVIDGNGYLLQSSPGGAYGIDLQATGVTVKNVHIKDYQGSGIRDASASGVTIMQNCLENDSDGIFVASSSGINIIENEFTANNYAIHLGDSSGVVISGNQISHNNAGIFAELPCNYTSIVGNNITANNDFGIFLQSQCIYDNIVGNNITANKDIFQNGTLGYGIWLGESSNHISITGNNIADNDHGILLDYLSGYDSIIGNSVTANNGYGICLYSSSNNTINHNDITENNNHGIWLDYSTNNIISDNNIEANSDCGIYSESSNSTSVSGNTITGNDGSIMLRSCCHDAIAGNNITNNEGGVYLFSSSDNMISGNSIAADTQYGVCLNSSNYNIISKNNVTNNYDGIYLLTSSENIISGNTIAENTQSGVSLNSSSTNRFFHNNFVDNQLQVYAVSSGYANVWDDGYPSGGNYWSNYIARYPDAIENDRTGIWNTPYVIDDDNIDRYPLLGLFKCFDVACYSQTYSVNTVSNSTISDVNFIAAAKTLSFNVTGTSGTVGFCRIVIPLSLMSCTNSEDWIVIVNGTRLYAPILNVTTDANYTYIYFTYHHSTETVQIQSTSAVPEFQPIMLLPLFMIATLLAIVICKRKNYKRKTCFE